MTEDIRLGRGEGLFRFRHYEFEAEGVKAAGRRGRQSNMAGERRRASLGSR